VVTGYGPSNAAEAHQLVMVLDRRMAVQQESHSAVPRCRRNYEVGGDDLLNEEVAQVLGVPFEVIPFKANKAGPAQVKDKRHHVHPIPSKSEFEIRFPRVEGYTQRVRNRVTVDCPAAPRAALAAGAHPTGSRGQGSERQQPRPDDADRPRAGR